MAENEDGDNMADDLVEAGSESGESQDQSTTAVAPTKAERRRRKFQDQIIAVVCIFGLLTIGIGVGRSTSTCSALFAKDCGMDKETPAQSLTVTWSQTYPPPSTSPIKETDRSNQQTAVWTRSLTVPEDTPEERNAEANLLRSAKEAGLTKLDSNHPAINLPERPEGFVSAGAVFNYCVFVLALFLLATLWECVNALTHKIEDRPLPLNSWRGLSAALCTVGLIPLTFWIFSEAQRAGILVTKVGVFAVTAILLLNLTHTFLFGKKPNGRPGSALKDLFGTHLAGKATAAAAIIGASAFTINRALEPLRNSIDNSAHRILGERGSKGADGTDNKVPPDKSQGSFTLNYTEQPLDDGELKKNVTTIKERVGNISDHVQARYDYQKKLHAPRDSTVTNYANFLTNQAIDNNNRLSKEFDAAGGKVNNDTDRFKKAKVLWAEGQVSTEQLKNIKAQLDRDASTLAQLEFERDRSKKEKNAADSRANSMKYIAKSSDDVDWGPPDNSQEKSASVVSKNGG